MCEPCLTLTARLVQPELPCEPLTLVLSMDFQKNEITQQVAQIARDFAQQQIKPHVMEWDESQTFPHELFKKLGELGLMGVLVPEQYGGAGLSYFEYKTAIEEISKVD